MSMYSCLGFQNPPVYAPIPRLNQVKVEMPNVGLERQGLVYLILRVNILKCLILT